MQCKNHSICHNVQHTKYKIITVHLTLYVGLINLWLLGMIPHCIQLKTIIEMVGWSTIIHVASDGILKFDTSANMYLYIYVCTWCILVYADIHVLVYIVHCTHALWKCVFFNEKGSWYGFMQTDIVTAVHIFFFT